MRLGHTRGPSVASVSRTLGDRLPAVAIGSIRGLWPPGSNSCVMSSIIMGGYDCDVFAVESR
jgi:hypothetical protein